MIVKYIKMRRKHKRKEWLSTLRERLNNMPDKYKKFPEIKGKFKERWLNLDKK